MRTVTAPLVVLAAALLALGGCGDDGDSGESDSTEPAAPTTQDGGCPYLGRDVVDEAVGGTVEVIRAGEGGCVFRAAADATALPGVLVTVTYTAIAIDVDEYADGTRDLCDDEPVEVDAGDTAFACTTFVAPQGFVYSGQDSVVVQVDDATDDATGVALAATLLPAVVPDP